MSNMKCVLVWLAVMTTTFHTSQALCWDGDRRYANGDIIVRGTNTTNLLAGHIEVCDASEWRAVCHHDWDERDARAACRQLEYTIGLSCRGSCFGRGSQEKGIRNFRCTDADRRLLQCSRSNQADTKCGNNAYAGIVCSNRTCQECPTPPLVCTRSSCQSTFPMFCRTCPTTAPTDDETPTTSEQPDGVETTISSPQPSGHETPPPTTELSTTAIGINNEPSTVAGATNTVEGGEQQSDSCPSLVAKGLGGLCAILAILLVGVIMGWVWTCHKKTSKSELQERDNTGPPHTSPNPSYTPTAIQYSSLGPRGTPHINSPPSSSATYDVIDMTSAPSQPQGTEERVYHVLEGPQEERGENEEGEYYLLGEAEGGEGLTYEVPIPTIPAPAQPATQQITEPMEYSRLQHK